jgi:hypothetical protein
LAFLGDCGRGLALLRSAVATLGEIGAHWEELEAYARLAEVLIFVGRITEARAALARARGLERDLGETHLGPLIERVELTLAALGDGMSPIALERFLERAQRVGATYEELVVLALAARSGDGTHHERLSRLTHDLGVVRLPMFVDA